MLWACVKGVFFSMHNTLLLRHWLVVAFPTHKKSLEMQMNLPWLPMRICDGIMPLAYILWPTLLIHSVGFPVSKKRQYYYIFRYENPVNALEPLFCGCDILVNICTHKDPLQDEVMPQYDIHALCVKTTPIILWKHISRKGCSQQQHMCRGQN